MCRSRFARLLVALLILALAGCGGGSVDNLMPGGGAFDGGELAGEGNLTPREASGLNGFAALPVDFNAQTVDRTAAWLRTDVTEAADGTVTLSVRAEKAAGLTQAFYQVVWPRDAYLLDDIRKGEFFKGEDLCAYGMRTPGVLDMGHARIDFGRVGGISGDGVLAQFIFVPGSGRRQTSFAVRNHADQTGTLGDIMYNTIYKVNRKTYYDGVGNDSLALPNQPGNVEDGTIFQSISEDYVDEPADIYFDGQTFMFNLVAYLPGDHDFNESVTVADITPIAMWYNSGFDTTGTPGTRKPFQDTLSTPRWTDEVALKDNTKSFYFLRWIDSNFDRKIYADDGVISLNGDDMSPVLGTLDRIHHLNERVETVYVVVSGDDGLGGQEYSYGSGDRLVILGDSGSFPHGDAEYLAKIGDGTFESTYGWYSYQNAPWRAENQHGGWPLEFAGVMNPDLMEAWGNTTTQSNGRWDQPSTDYFMYWGTVGHDSSGDTHLGVLTPIGAWNPTGGAGNGDWAPEDLSDANGMFDDAAGATNATVPKMVPQVGSTRTQTLPLKEMRKTIAFDSGNDGILGSREDYYDDLLADWDWTPSWQNGAQGVYSGGNWAIYVRFPQAYDISGVEYECYITTESVWQTGPQANSFFTDIDESVMKTDVEREVLTSYTGAHMFGMYDGARLQSNETYYVMVRPVDGEGNFPPGAAGFTSFVTTDSNDSAAPDFDGLISVTPGPDINEVTVVFHDASEDKSWPISFDLRYALVSAHADDAAFVAAYSSLGSNVIDTKGAFDPDVSSRTEIITMPGCGSQYRFLMRASDYAGNFDTNSVVKVATPPCNVPPAWGTTPGVVNVKENGSGAVEIYFNDANDPDGVQYRVAYAKRSDFDNSDKAFQSSLFWTAYDGGTGSGNVTKGTWTNEGSLSSGAPYAAYKITVSGLTNEVEYHFAIRARDGSGSPIEDTNTATVGCRPTQFSWSVFDSADNYSGYYADIAAIDYSASGNTHTRVGVSYLNSATLPSEEHLMDIRNANELRYGYYDTNGGSVTAVDVTNRTATKVAFGETSICFLNDKAKPGIAFFGSDDAPFSDLNADGTLSTAPPGTNGGSVGGGTGHGGSYIPAEQGYYAVMYAEDRSGTWWLDSVDYLTDLSGMFTALGHFNGICAYEWQHPDGVTRWSPFVSYSSAFGLGGPMKSRFLVSQETNKWWWRPFVDLDSDGKTSHVDSRNAVTMSFDLIGYEYGTDVLISNASGSDRIYQVNAARMVGGDPIDDVTSMYGAVSNSMTDMLDRVAPMGWGFNETSTPDPWDEWGSTSSDWFIDNATPSTDANSQFDGEYVIGTKSVSHSGGFGSAILTTEGMYYLSNSMSTKETIETFSGTDEITGWRDPMGFGYLPHVSVGMAYDSSGNPAVVYPAFYNDDDRYGWALHVAKRSGGGSWTITRVLYNSPDVFVRQADFYYFNKIAFLHSGKWFVATTDLSYRPFNSESAGQKQHLLYLIEP